MQNRLTIKDIARLSGVGNRRYPASLTTRAGQRTDPRARRSGDAAARFLALRSARAMRGQSDKVVAIIVTRLDSLSENLAVQTMLPAFYEQGYDPIMMESQFSRRWWRSISACSPGAILTAWCCSVLPASTKRCSPLARHPGADGPRRSRLRLGVL